MSPISRPALFPKEVESSMMHVEAKGLQRLQDLKHKRR